MLASVADYTARYGTPDDTAKVSYLLEDASSLVQQVAGMNIARVDDETVTIETGGDNVAFLPNIPVTDVASVTVDGDAVTDFDWWNYGMLVRNDGVWPNKPRSVEVVYSHGFDPVPYWLVNLVCSMAERARTHGAEGGIKSESFVDAYAVTYNDPKELSEVVGLHVDEVGQVRALNIAKAIA